VAIRAVRARSVWTDSPYLVVIGVGSTHMSGNMSDDWLELLLAGVSVDAIYHRRDELVQAGVDAVHAERQAGAAVRLHALLDERHRRVLELTALNDIAAQLTSTHAVDELLPQITAQARRLLGVDCAYIGVLHG
jgi:hypothetical protein